MNLIKNAFMSMKGMVVFILQRKKDLKKTVVPNTDSIQIEVRLSKDGDIVPSIFQSISFHSIEQSMECAEQYFSKIAAEYHTNQLYFRMVNRGEEIVSSYYQRFVFSN